MVARYNLPIILAKDHGIILELVSSIWPPLSKAQGSEESISLMMALLLAKWCSA